MFSTELFLMSEPNQLNKAERVIRNINILTF